MHNFNKFYNELLYEMAPIGLLIGLSIAWFLIVITLVVTASRRKNLSLNSANSLKRKLKKELTLEERKLIEEELAKRGKFYQP